MHPIASVAASPQFEVKYYDPKLHPDRLKIKLNGKKALKIILYKEDFGRYPLACLYDFIEHKSVSDCNALYTAIASTLLSCTNKKHAYILEAALGQIKDKVGVEYKKSLFSLLVDKIKQINATNHAHERAPYVRAARLIVYDIINNDMDTAVELLSTAHKGGAPMIDDSSVYHTIAQTAKFLIPSMDWKTMVYMPDDNEDIIYVHPSNPREFNSCGSFFINRNASLNPTGSYYKEICKIHA